MAKRNEVTVIIRSAGERTVPVIWKLLKQQVSESQIFEVKEVPNSRALKKAYKIAINDNRKWLLLIDGDVLPLESMLKRLLSIGEGLNERVFCIQCDLIDKMVLNFRPAGVHMYRTSLLKKAVELIPAENRTMRPESTTMGRMAKRGYPTLFMEEVLGLHDYEQYYKDLFRKGFFSAHKHTKYLTYFKKIWAHLINIDEDYKLLLEGLTKGEQYEGLVVSNTEDFKNVDISNILAEKGMSKKDKLDIEKINFEWIDKVYKNFEIPTEFYNAQFISGKDHKKISFKRRLLQLKGKLGLLKLIPWVAGNFLEKIGASIKNKLEV